MNKKIFILAALVLVVAAFIGGAYFVKRQSGNSTADDLVRTDTPIYGNSDAKVTVVEFLDPECEACAAFYPVLKAVLRNYPNDVRLAVRYMLYHGNSQLAAVATEAAGRQGKYWEMQELLFTQAHLWSHQKAPPYEAFAQFARTLGLDDRQFQLDLYDRRLHERVTEDFKDGLAKGIKGTPTIFVNGRMVTELSPVVITKMIEEELEKFGSTKHDANQASDPDKKLD